jgi:mono/diheme cytochrome c family protein
VQPLQYQKLNAAIGARGNCVVCHGPDAGLTPEMSPHHPMR